MNKYIKDSDEFENGRLLIKGSVSIREKALKELEHDCSCDNAERIVNDVCDRYASKKCTTCVSVGENGECINSSSLVFGKKVSENKEFGCNCHTGGVYDVY